MKYTFDYNTTEAYEIYILDISNGSKEALELLYNKTKSYVYGYAFSLLNNVTDAEYVINAKTGDIIFSEVDSENDNNSTKPSTKPTSTSTTLISKGKAKTIELNHADVTNYYDYDIELDNKNGVKIYEIDFETKEYEYEYEINATTGKILKSEKERRD